MKTTYQNSFDLNLKQNVFYNDINVSLCTELDLTQSMKDIWNDFQVL